MLPGREETEGDDGGDTTPLDGVELREGRGNEEACPLTLLPREPGTELWRELSLPEIADDDVLLRGIDTHWQHCPEQEPEPHAAGQSRRNPSGQVIETC